MKYTKKQILKGMKEWTTQDRLSPSTVMSDKECRSLDLDEMAELKTNALITYMK